VTDHQRDELLIVFSAKLKAKIIGRGWRIKRDDLEGYVKKL
jgi:hypothetical protein